MILPITNLNDRKEIINKKYDLGQVLTDGLMQGQIKVGDWQSAVGYLQQTGYSSPEEIAQAGQMLAGLSPEKVAGLSTIQQGVTSPSKFDQWVQNNGLDYDETVANAGVNATNLWNKYNDGKVGYNLFDDTISDKFGNPTNIYGGNTPEITKNVIENDPFAPAREIEKKAKDLQAQIQANNTYPNPPLAYESAFDEGTLQSFADQAIKEGNNTPELAYKEAINRGIDPSLARSIATRVGYMQKPTVTSGVSETNSPLTDGGEFGYEQVITPHPEVPTDSSAYKPYDPSSSELKGQVFKQYIGTIDGQDQYIDLPAGKLENGGIGYWDGNKTYNYAEFVGYDENGNPKYSGTDFAPGTFGSGPYVNPLNSKLDAGTVSQIDALVAQNPNALNEMPPEVRRLYESSKQANSTQTNTNSIDALNYNNGFETSNNSQNLNSISTSTNDQSSLVTLENNTSIDSSVVNMIASDPSTQTTFENIKNMDADQKAAALSGLSQTSPELRAAYDVWESNQTTTDTTSSSTTTSSTSNIGDSTSSTTSPWSTSTSTSTTTTSTTETPTTSTSSSPIVTPTTSTTTSTSGIMKLNESTINDLMRSIATATQYLEDFVSKIESGEINTINNSWAANEASTYVSKVQAANAKIRKVTEGLNLLKNAYSKSLQESSSTQQDVSNVVNNI